MQRAKKIQNREVPKHSTKDSTSYIQGVIFFAKLVLPFFKKIIFVFIYVLCTSMSVYAHVCAGSNRGQRRVLHTLEL